MVEIYNYDITTHERFAKDQQDIEAFRKQYHIPAAQAKIIDEQTRILDFVPKHPAIVLLMQTYQHKIWARFVIPQDFYSQRTPSNYIAPSLGSVEKQDADIYKLKAFVKSQTRGKRVLPKEDRKGVVGIRNREEQLLDESDSIIKMLDDGVKLSNKMVDEIIGKVYQFIQG